MTAATESESRAAMRPPADPNAHRVEVLSVDIGTWSSVSTLWDGSVVPDNPGAETERALAACVLTLLSLPEVQSDGPNLVNHVNDALARDQDGPVLGELTEVAERIKATAGTDGESSRLLRAVIWAFDQWLASVDDDGVRTRVGSKRFALYNEAFDELPLRAQNLWPLPIGSEHEVLETSSVLSVVKDDFARSTLLNDATLASNSTGLLFRQIKSKLAEVVEEPALSTVANVPAGWKPDTELLLGKTLADIVRRVEQGVLDSGAVADLTRIKSARLGRAVLTYPTTLAPQARRRMHRLAVDALGLPENDVYVHWDEAVAAALYFMLREFGGYREAGIDTFRHRAHLIGDPVNPTWQRVSLLVDIGGGTTDIALLAMNLRQQASHQRATRTPTGADLSGRAFELRPVVLGTTGHPQLGGNLLTLRMFYWLKAAIADAVRGGEGESLAERVLANKSPDPVPKDVRLRLRSEVPTDGDGPTPLFLALWAAMENAKRAPEDDVYQWRMVEVFPKRLPTGTTWVSKLAGVVDQIALTREDYARLCRPVVEAAVRLGGYLVRRTLGGKDVPLDVVALSGRTTGVPGAEDLVRDVLRRELAHGTAPVGWPAEEIVVERDRAKQAASIGAAWAGATAVATGDSAAELGRDRLRIEVSGLLGTLPMDLGLVGTEGKAPVLLRAGTPFDMVDSIGRWSKGPFTRSSWRRYNGGRLVNLHRKLSEAVPTGMDSIQWGKFNLPPESASPPDLWFQVQVEQDLTPSVLLCRGSVTSPRPRLYTDAGHDEASVQALVITSVSAGVVPRVAVRAVGGGHTEPVLLFGGGPASEVLHCDVLSDTRRHGARPGEVWTTAAISENALPRVEPGGAYQFTVDGVDSGTPIVPPTFAPGSGPSAETPRWAVLTGGGSLRVHASYPSYLPAESLEQALARPGMVYQAPMVDGFPDRIPEWDPFTGDH
ncbi:hypothetical protein [Actinokineospora diospyrosa]|uniref:Virulence factor SrfB n=1 Tax=Actinokineospora diospyrosa TaxID=103728 RepID=A0ABT1IK62_9PSEU|nr:hypothetical protein [Actinokineospora diospyrosa]MCP2272596.1 Virulence factor SrfB [Actinokineospora diospyrosa]